MILDLYGSTHFKVHVVYKMGIRLLIIIWHLKACQAALCLLETCEISHTDQFPLNVSFN